MDHFFTTRKLTVGYGGEPLIRDIDISLRRGQILALIGPNGSGKSTILKSIVGQLRRICGTVYIDGRDTGAMNGRDLARRVAVVLTDRVRPELMTCEDVAATGRHPHTGLLGVLSAGDRAAVRRAMEMVGAWELRDRDFAKISDGQRQRVLLARAICQEPEVIVLDEPTSFLDVRYELELLQSLRAMAAAGITVILSLHSLAMAQRVSDLVMCVKGETITHLGPPEEIFREELIGELYGLEEGGYNPLFGSFELPRPRGEAWVFVIAGGGSGIPEYRALQKRGIPFATGILHENDVDEQVARALAAEVIRERAFAPIGEESFARALRALAGCEAVINALRGYGEMNEANRQLHARALELGLRDVERAAML